MSARNRSLSSTGRIAVWATIAALVLTMAEPPMAAASPATVSSKGLSATSASDATDFSSARRRRRYYRQVDPGLAMMGMMIGTIGMIAAQQRRREYYDYRYGYAPGYYGGGPYYYGGGYYGGPYYAPRFYRPYRRW